ncbi:hypothetical protein NBRC111894_1156 [Sporolactobacillus inulinus]|uniref:Uncharacterized protein n=1 Tax=Sporolactobacillus inulinus TaxID=2078 RepID=A0A4Y1Z974_9BACL|nr:hypothetical protein NBRC111894_1156 [Sporolactobacillus inulinus]
MNRSLSREVNVAESKVNRISIRRTGYANVFFFILLIAVFLFFVYRWELQTLVP